MAPGFHLHLLHIPIYIPSFFSSLSSHPPKSPLLTPVKEAFNRRLDLFHLRAVDLSLSIYSLFGESFALFPVLFRGIRGSLGLVEARRGDLIAFCGFAGAI